MVGAALAAGWLASAGAVEDLPLTDVPALNAAIGFEYQTLVTEDTLVAEALRVPLIAYGAVHDQPEAARQFLRLADALRRRSRSRLQFGIEFVDRGDWDLLARYLERSLDETELLKRLFPTSMLLLPASGPAHLQILRYARRHHVEVVPLESRPGGARPLVLRNAEIRWNLASHLGRHATQRLLVYYGVRHLVGDDAITAGLETPLLTITSYGDSLLEDFARREGRYPAGGEVVRICDGFYFQAVGGPPRPPAELAYAPGEREALLTAIEAVYRGQWSKMGLLVAALDDRDIRWRRAAFHGLRQAAEHSFGYDPEATAAARAGAIRQWNDWWGTTANLLVIPPAADPGEGR